MGLSYPSISAAGATAVTDGLVKWNLISEPWSVSISAGERTLPRSFLLHSSMLDLSLNRNFCSQYHSQGLYGYKRSRIVTKWARAAGLIQRMGS